MNCIATQRKIHLLANDQWVQYRLENQHGNHRSQHDSHQAKVLNQHNTGYQIQHDVSGNQQCQWPDQFGTQQNLAANFFSGPQNGAEAEN